jgi:hypothetical protein
MHELDRQQELRGVNPRSLKRKALRLPDVEEQVPSADVLHDEVELALLVQIAIQLHDEGTTLKLFCYLKLLSQVSNVLFPLCLRSVLVVLLQNLNSEYFASKLFQSTFDQYNRAIRSLSDSSLEVELFVDIFGWVKELQGSRLTWPCHHPVDLLLYENALLANQKALTRFCNRHTLACHLLESAILTKTQLLAASSLL